MRRTFRTEAGHEVRAGAVSGGVGRRVRPAQPRVECAFAEHACKQKERSVTHGGVYCAVTHCARWWVLACLRRGAVVLQHAGGGVTRDALGVVHVGAPPPPARRTRCSRLPHAALAQNFTHYCNHHNKFNISDSAVKTDCSTVQLHDVVTNTNIYTFSYIRLPILLLYYSAASKTESLGMNLDKSKVMYNDNASRKPISVEGIILGVVQKYIYLGKLVRDGKLRAGNQQMCTARLEIITSPLPP